jgi:hypothetical protein
MPTVADVETIAKTLGSILAGKPQRHGALTVIPILAPMQTEPEWVTLAEAGGRVRIALAGSLRRIADRLVGSLRVVRNHVYHPDFGGRRSLELEWLMFQWTEPTPGARFA